MKLRSVASALFTAALWFALDPLAASEQKLPARGETPATPAAKKIDPAFAPIVDDPRLPRVLLIGDSISIDYTIAVRKELAGAANVHRPPANCGSTKTALSPTGLPRWLGDSKWDVIHFNHGLHDLSYRFADDSDKNAQGEYASPANGGHQNVSPAEYEKSLRRIVAQLKQTGAKLIFANTTPVPASDAAKYVPDSERPYNEIARKVMADEGVAWNDLWSLVKPRLAELQIPRNVHFTTAGSTVMAKQVAQRIQSALPPSSQPPAPNDAAWLRTHGTLIFHDAFEREETGNGAKAIGNGWNSATADRVPQIKMADLDAGILKISSATKEAGHAAHIHHEAGFTDGGAIVRFKFPGLTKGETLQLGFVDRETKGVHAGHLCYGILSPTSVTLIDHKTGVMNLEIRQRRQTYLDRKEKLPADLDALLKTKQVTVPWKADTDWHELVLVTEGDVLRLSLDGKVVARHRSAGFAHPMKRWFSFLVPSTVWIDDVKIWKVK
jgi:acyl-CoA thioesterase-1